MKNQRQGDSSGFNITNPSPAVAAETATAADTKAQRQQQL